MEQKKKKSIHLSLVLYISSNFPKDRMPRWMVINPCSAGKWGHHTDTQNYMVIIFLG